MVKLFQYKQWSGFGNYYSAEIIVAPSKEAVKKYLKGEICGEITDVSKIKAINGKTYKFKLVEVKKK